MLLLHHFCALHKIPNTQGTGQPSRWSEQLWKKKGKGKRRIKPRNRRTATSLVNAAKRWSKAAVVPRKSKIPAASGSLGRVFLKGFFPERSATPDFSCFTRSLPACLSIQPQKQRCCQLLIIWILLWCEQDKFDPRAPSQAQQRWTGWRQIHFHIAFCKRELQ